MLTKKQVTRALRFAEPVLVEQFGRDQAREMLLAMKASYQDLEPGIPQFRHPPIEE
ncbi:MAG: hypothetical protein MI924_15890 [Chloroflexales bacterium]|nr:hypothetical protein [Chloroflexales bacterium]